MNSSTIKTTTVLSHWNYNPLSERQFTDRIINTSSLSIKRSVCVSGKHTKMERERKNVPSKGTTMVTFFSRFSGHKTQWPSPFKTSKDIDNKFRFCSSRLRVAVFFSESLFCQHCFKKYVSICHTAMTPHIWLLNNCYELLGVVSEL